ncbi:MAG: hypothetical protein E7041_00335 [Lentisphaerae bacterium]|nr:hypothetical protein [Lentisphaerota bacterium]
MLIQSDYHIHASFYRPKNPGDVAGPTVREQIDAARNVGNKYVGILEHCNASPRHPFHCLEEMAAEFYAPGFERENVFLGVESDLSADGSDHCGCSGREKLRLDYVIGSVHASPKTVPDFDDYLQLEYQCITNALKYNDNIDIIGHPYGEGVRWEKAGIIEKWSWSLIPETYLEEILHLAKESGKALEINRCLLEDKVYIDFWSRIRDNGIIFSVGSDAHFPETLPEAAVRTKWLENLGLTESNNWRIKK